MGIASRSFVIPLTLAFILTAATLMTAQADIYDRVTHGYAESEGGVKIHYASLGQGAAGRHDPRLPRLLVHVAAPDDGLSDRFQVVAIDQRGYNLSDKPKGVENYDMRMLVGDVAAVIKHLGRDKATIVGHDWGGVVAWQFAMNLPQMTERLIILNLPHPERPAARAATNPEQIENSEYARNFQTKSPSDPTVFFGRPMTAETLSCWVRDPAARKRYVEAFERSDFERDAELLQAQLPERLRRRCAATARMPKVQDAGPHVSRPRRHRAASRRAVGHLELAGEGPHARDRARRRALRPAGRRRSRHVDHAMVAVDAHRSLMTRVQPLTM